MIHPNGAVLGGVSSIKGKEILDEMLKIVKQLLHTINKVQPKYRCLMVCR